ncbi:Ecp41 [Fulvia fulva]|uniref:Ecp41 n=1 Tax=Passalora fulva TaxID=5499 RepID=A0A1P8YXL8_PASFU|nr:Ecp41 [Fulvia fulva]AQA29253.1 extracellular protein 41 [Fulvia fulva]KAK4619025.1 Ecp41 [Fulvia fulva]UJO21190.1 Ecp41 [Fulvia fulva]WPV32731.1 Ecp41 [Fulvia fulva]
MKLQVSALLFLCSALVAAQCEDPSDDSGRCDFGNQYLCKQAEGGRKYNNCAQQARGRCADFCPDLVRAVSYPACVPSLANARDSAEWDCGMLRRSTVPWVIVMTEIDHFAVLKADAIAIARLDGCVGPAPGSS